MINLDVFRWAEEDVFSNFANIINEKPTFINKDNYAVWIRKSPFCLCAHADVSGTVSSARKWDSEKGVFVYETVSKEKHSPVEVFRAKNIITAKDAILGGDDRAGIAAIMEIDSICVNSGLQRPSIILTRGEECGGLGIKKMIEELDKKVLSDTRLILSLDRRGCAEYVYYTEPKDEVKIYIELFGFHKCFGSYSDCKDISEEWLIPHANLSIGYYNNHSKSEVVFLDETMLTVFRVVEMIKDPIQKRYEIEKKVYQSYNNYYDNSHNNWRCGGKVEKWDTAEYQRRIKKCNELKDRFKLPSSCLYSPYLDYYLTTDLIKDGFHIVSSPDKKKPIEEWLWLFDSNKEPGAISKIWRDRFGKARRLYVRAGKKNEFLLAVDCSKSIYFSAFSAEREEAAIIENNKALSKRLEEKKKSSNEEKKQNEIKDDGFCTRFYEGSCHGPCNGHRDQCVSAGGPKITWSESVGDNFYMYY